MTWKMIRSKYIICSPIFFYVLIISYKQTFGWEHKILNFGSDTYGNFVLKQKVFAKLMKNLFWLKIVVKIQSSYKKFTKKFEITSTRIKVGILFRVKDYNKQSELLNTVIGFQ